MPNHVTNILSFEGHKESIVELKNKIKGGEDQGIDFDKIIPRPNSLDITSGSKVDYGVAVLMFREKRDASKLLPLLNYPWVKAENINTPEKLANYLVKEDKADLEMARIALDNLEKHGHQDWYSWSIANWGTKWNAYSVSDDGETITFDTAWSTPLPVIQKLSEMFPDVKITLKFADEDFGYNCGEIVLLAGDSIEENIPAGGSGEAYVLAGKIQQVSLEQMLSQIADSEDENFISNLLTSMFEQFSPKEVIDELEFSSDELYCSNTFLTTLKQTLIENELYEFIAKVDNIMTATENKGEQ